MAKQCTICTNERIAEINQAVIGGDSLRKIAQDFALSYDALYRHNKHIPLGLAKAREAIEVTQADSLLHQVQELQEKALQLLAQAEAAGDLKTALQGVREARSCLELLAKMQGELQQEGTINITVMPEWVELRAVILQAVEPFPDALQAITGALGGVQVD